MGSLLGTLTPMASFFSSQVSGDSFVQDIFYAMATVCLLFVVAAVGLIDAGLVRRKNLLDTWVQKLVCAMRVERPAANQGDAGDVGWRGNRERGHGHIGSGWTEVSGAGLVDRHALVGT